VTKLGNADGYCITEKKNVIRKDFGQTAACDEIALLRGDSAGSYGNSCNRTCRRAGSDIVCTRPFKSCSPFQLFSNAALEYVVTRLGDPAFDARNAYRRG